MKWNKIIFDMDGVITGEHMYWYAAALTVYELLFGRESIDLSKLDEIHDTIFCGIGTINALKKRGVNTNWDLTLVTYCVSLHINPNLDKLDSEHFKKVCKFAQNMPHTADEVYDMAYSVAANATGKNPQYFERENSEIWDRLQDMFDSWLIDGELYKMERCIVPLDELRKLLEWFKNCGITLGIGTGRPRAGLKRPLQMWDIAHYFDKDSLASYSDVELAEETCESEESLGKPHPYIFLKAAAQGKYSDEEILNGSHEIITDGVLVVGDAVADFVSAKDAGFAFAAVLTGVSGEDMRGYFEENGADYIFDNVLGLRQL